MPRPRSAEKREKKFSAPASETEVTDYARACKKVDVVPAEMLRKLAAAFVEHVDEHGYIVLPVRFAPPPTKKQV